MSIVRQVVRGGLAVAILAAALSLSGCGILDAMMGDGYEADDSPATQSRRAKEFAVMAYEAAGMEGEPTAEVSEMTPDHKVAAQFILQQQGRDSDLSSYKSVEVVTLTKPDGTEILAVVLNSEEAVIAGGN